MKIAKAYADGSGALHVTTSDGQDIRIPKEKGQAGADEIKITDDHQTVGWLVVYPNPDANRDWEKLYGELVLWRDGKVTRRFSTEQVFWSWDFWQDGKQVGFTPARYTAPADSSCTRSPRAVSSQRSMRMLPRPCLTGRSHWTTDLFARKRMRRSPQFVEFS